MTDVAKEVDLFGLVLTSVLQPAVKSSMVVHCTLSVSGGLNLFF